MILIDIAHIIHLTTEEEDAKPAQATLLPRQRCVRLFLLQGVERHAAVLETDGDAVGLLDVHIQEALGTFWIGIRRHIHDNLFASQPQRQGLF